MTLFSMHSTLRGMNVASTPEFDLIIVAAGQGLRLGGGLPKQYRPLAGQPLLRRTIESALAVPGLRRLQIVIDPQARPLYDAATAGLALPPPVAGGADRQASVRAGLAALGDAPADLVLVHDAARPFADAALYGRVLAGLARAEAAIPGIAVADTLKRGQGGMVAATVDRSDIFAVQTPQGFRHAALAAAHAAHAGAQATDDAALIEAAGGAVALVEGDAGNVKLTTESDWAAAERRLSARRDTITGQGFDVHEFGPGDHVTLGNIRIPHDHGLIGHSDADVLLHAATDAILGTIGAGDIGTHFPPSDMRWRGADSAQFLTHAVDLLKAEGGRLLALDLTLLSEAPRIGPHRAAITARLAALTGLPPRRIGLKATTTERLGFVGRREGMAAMALATVDLPAIE